MPVVKGATENATVVSHLLNDIGRRGVDFEVPRLYVLDGGKALHKAVYKAAGKCALIQRVVAFTVLTKAKMTTQTAAQRQPHHCQTTPIHPSRYTIPFHANNGR